MAGHDPTLERGNLDADGGCFSLLYCTIIIAGATTDVGVGVADGQIVQDDSVYK